MRYDPDKHRRGSMRLPGTDYAAPGAYFVTVCAYGGVCLFGQVVGGAMRLGDYGRVVQACWDDLPNHYPHVRLDAFVIMPNHVHGVIVLVGDGDVTGRGRAGSTGEDPARPGVGVDSDLEVDDVGAGFKRAPTDVDPDAEDVGAGFKPAPTPAPRKRHALPEIVRALKTFSARRINEIRGTPGVPVWQRNYYDHIVRNDDELRRIRRYIQDNPRKWELDRENPALAKR